MFVMVYIKFFLVFNFHSYFIFQFIAFMIIILFMVKSLN